MNIPSKRQWAQFFSVLSKKQRRTYVLLFIVFVISSAYLLFNYYYANTSVYPDFGGQYKEGLIGQPRFINPLYLSDNDSDRDLVEILFSSLLKHNENGKIVNDLTKEFSIENNGKDYVFQIQQDILWHDGKPLTSEDIVFTIELVQSPQYKSPLRVEWLGVRIEEKGQRDIVFHLQKPYASFLETISRLKILPKHIFQDISPDNFPWILTAKQYLIGTGPFKVKEIKQDKSDIIKRIEMERNDDYYGQKPYLNKLSLYFYQSLDELIKGGRTGQIDGFSVSDPKYVQVLEKEGFNLQRINLPRYFAMFFNLGSKSLNKDLRQALNYAIDKNKILENVFLNEGKTVNSPILPDYYGFNSASEPIEFNIEKAEQLFDKQGYVLNPETNKREKDMTEALSLFKRDLNVKSSGQDVTDLQTCLARDPDVYPDGTVSGYFGSKTKAAVIKFQEKYAEEILEPIGLTAGTGKVGGMTRDKLNQICQDSPEELLALKFNITTSDKSPLIDIAQEIKAQMQALGAEVEIEQLSLSELQNTLNKREFEILLFGQALGSLPDPFPFWHSSQKDYPGLNITKYNSKQADKYMEKARESIEIMQENLEMFQDELLEDSPAVFLVRGDFFFFLPPKIKGYGVINIVEPSKRLSTIETWYINTKRVWE